MTTPHKYTKLEVELIGALMRCEEISEEAEDLLIRIGVAGRREVFNPATLIVYWLFERDFDKLAEIKKGGGGMTKSKEHDCSTEYGLDYDDLKKVDHPENSDDFPNERYRGQGYQVYQCKKCGRYHGIRWQWDTGTGQDDRHKAFGFDPKKVKRHY